MFFRRNQQKQELARLRVEAQLQAELASAAMAQAAEQRRQYENRIADIKEASEQRAKELLRTVKALADEVEYLRAQHFGPGRSQTASAIPAVPVDPEWDFMPGQELNPHYLSEEEEELAALQAGGHIDDVEYKQALSQLRAAVGGVPIQVQKS